MHLELQEWQLIVYVLLHWEAHGGGYLLLIMYNVIGGTAHLRGKVETPTEYNNPERQLWERRE